jgi:hypothetical protein
MKFSCSFWLQSFDIKSHKNQERKKQLKWWNIDFNEILILILFDEGGPS